MVVVQTLLDSVKSYALTYIQNEVDRIQVGSSNTAPTAGDTALGTLLATGVLEEEDTSVPGEITYSVKFGISSFVGSTVRECALYNSVGARILTRNLTVESLKGADQIFWVTIKIKVIVLNG